MVEPTQLIPQLIFNNSPVNRNKVKCLLWLNLSTRSLYSMHIFMDSIKYFNLLTFKYSLFHIPSICPFFPVKYSTNPKNRTTKNRFLNSSKSPIVRQGWSFCNCLSVESSPLLYTRSGGSWCQWGEPIWESGMKSRTNYHIIYRKISWSNMRNCSWIIDSNKTHLCCLWCCAHIKHPVCHGVAKFDIQSFNLWFLMVLEQQKPINQQWPTTDHRLHPGRRFRTLPWSWSSRREYKMWRGHCLQIHVTVPKGMPIVYSLLTRRSRDFRRYIFGLMRVLGV